MTTERCGWCSASSGVIRPMSTRCCTNVWSVVTCVSTLVAHQVAARVAQVHHRELVAGAQDGQHGRAHARELGVGLAAGDDLLARVGQRGLELVQRVVGTVRLAVQRRERRDRHRRGDVTARVPAHAVRDHEQVRPGVGRVLVVGAHEPDVGPCRISECDGHRLPLQLEHALSHADRCTGRQRESGPRRAGPPRMSRSSIRGPRRTTGHPAGRSVRAATTSSRRPGRACSWVRDRAGPPTTRAG